MTEQALYFVSSAGERHEDHNPIGVFTWNELINRYGAIKYYDNVLKPEDFEDNKFKEIQCLDLNGFEFEDGDVEFFASDQFEVDIEKTKEIFGDDPYYDGVIRNLWIIKVQINADMPTT